MNRLFIAPLALALLSTSAFAKITVFSSQMALQTVLESQLLQQSIPGGSGLELISVQAQITGEGGNKQFEFTMNYGDPANPQWPCTGIVSIESKVKNVTLSSGSTIASSELLEPVLKQSFVCLE